MSQVPAGQWGLPATGPATGAQVAARANATFDALRTHHSGPSEPENLVDGMDWLDTSIANQWQMKTRRGNSWTTRWTLNPTTGDFKIAGLSQGENKVINGDFRVNQRGYVSNATLALSAFGFDRWKATTASSKMVFTANPAGQQVTITGSFAQVIEQQDLPAGTYILSWTGTAQGRCYKSGASAPAYAAGPRTVTIDGAGNYLVEFNAGTLGEVRLDLGTVAQPFQQRSYAAELALCQRYYEIGKFVMAAQATAAAQDHGNLIAFKVTKRTATPTVAAGAIQDAINSGALTIDRIDSHGARAYVPSNAAGPVVVSFTWAALAEL